MYEHEDDVCELELLPIAEQAELACNVAAQAADEVVLTLALLQLLKGADLDDTETTLTRASIGALRDIYEDLRMFFD